MAMEIFTVGRGQEGYPERLMPFADMPSRLFVRGALPADEQKTAAIVGARICTAYGKSQAAFFAQVLAANGVAVISGMACGIDAAAHEGALRGKGKTFAVLGCGVDICYPKQNYSLMRRMLENGGGVLSEFPPGAEPLPWHFPIRNRVISALADVVLVIEAKEKSGSLITADYALEQGKTVFALPGRTTDATSRGCNRLIADGAAALITDSWDVLREYEAQYPHKILGERVELPRTLGYQAREELARAKQTAVEETPALPELNLKTNDLGLTDDQMAILRALKAGALQVDDLIEKTQIPTRRVLSALTMMELEGYVEQSGGKHFSLTVTLLEE